MWKKYFVRQGKEVIGIKHHIIREELVIGGWLRCMHTAENLLHCFFKKKKYKEKFTTQNKFRLELKVTRNEFKKFRFNIEDSGFILQETVSHGRLFR